MIKKILKSILSLWIITLWIINFSNASWFWHGVVWNYSQYQNSDYSLMIARYWEFNTDYLWTVKRVFSINSDSMFYWNVDWYLHWTDMWWFDWKLLNYYVCDYVNWDFSQFTNCSKYLYTGWNIDVVNNMLSFIKVWDRFFYGAQWTYYTNLVFHAVSISDLQKTVVFAFGGCWSSNWTACGVSDWTNWYMGLDIHNDNDTKWLDASKRIIWIENPSREQWYNFWTIPNNLIWVSPVFTWGGWSDTEDEQVWIDPDSTESALNLYENRYWRNKSICYVWINNSSTLWWSSVSFQEWSWLTIFQLYDQLYWTGDLNHYAVFVNNWLLNYEQWFNTSGSPMYLSNYNSWTNQVELYYDNLSFPFANNPIAVYFMSNNISLKSPESTMWSSVVSYCNIKLNNWTFDDILDEADKINAVWYTEQTNVNKWYNADWTVRKINIWEFGMNTWSWVISWNLDGWSFAEDYWVSYYTWVNNITEWFQSLFDKLDNAFSTLSDMWTGYTWILPSYIVFALLFVVLFKIMRR